MRRVSVASCLTALLLGPVLPGGTQSKPSPRDIISRSVKAHGGDRLRDWKSMTIQGTVDMSDGIVFKAAYRVFAKAPGRLRVEKDMTAARGGRYFYEYFLNNGVAWSRRNLVPERGNLDEMNRWLNQCYGIAHYADKAESLVRKEDAVVEWREKADLQSTAYKVVAARPAYVITAAVGKETADLYIDKENYFFLQEVSGRTKRVFWDFKKFADVTMPTKLLEIVAGARGEQITPYTYDSVKFDIPIDDWRFSEDMPKAGVIGK